MRFILGKVKSLAILSSYTSLREGAIHLIDSGTPSLEERLFIPLVAVRFPSSRGIRFC